MRLKDRLIWFDQLLAPFATILTIFSCCGTLLLALTGLTLREAILIDPQMPECTGRILIEADDPDGHQCKIIRAGDYEAEYESGVYKIDINKDEGVWRAAFLVFEGNTVQWDPSIKPHPDRDKALESAAFIDSTNYASAQTAQDAALSSGKARLHNLKDQQVLTFVASDIREGYEDNSGYVIVVMKYLGS